MTLTLAWWHLWLLISLAIFGINFTPAHNDAYGVGAFLRFVATVIAILLMWLIYFATRFMIG